MRPIMSGPISIVLLLTFDLVYSAKILLLPLPKCSHVSPMTTLGDALIESGHEVFIFLPHLYNQLANVKAASKVKVIEYPIKAWEWNAAMFAGRVDTEMDYFDYVTQTSYLSDMKAKGAGFHLICKAVMSSKILERTTKQGLTFDLAVIDAHPFARCNYALAYKYDIPHVSYMQEYDPWLYRSPSNPSYVPAVIAEDLTDRMTFWQRIVNIWIMTYWTKILDFPTYTDDYIASYIPEKDSSNDVSVTDLVAQTRFWLSDSNFLLDYSRPVASNEQLIGVSLMREASPLPKAMDAAANNITTDGIIVVSLDQNIALPARIMAVLLKTFKVYSTYQIYWQYSMDLPEENLPQNLKIMSYAPLNNLLGHPSAKLLITSADNLDQNIALYHGIPILCLPLDGHQRYNAKRTVYRGYGTVLQPQTLTLKILHSTIKQLLFSNNKTKTIREASAIMRTNQPTARKAMTDWVELAVKSNLTTLQPVATDMPWASYFMIDILFVVAVLFGNGVFLVYNTWAVCWKRLRSLKRVGLMHNELVMTVQGVVSSNKATVTVPVVASVGVKNLKQQ